MLLDKQNLFSDNQNVLQNCNSANLIYFGKNDVSYLPLLIQITADFVGTTSVTVEIETSATISFQDPRIIASSSLSAPDLVAGNRFPISHMPKGNLGYIRLKYVVTGTTTGGKITAGIVLGDGLSWHEQ